MCISEKEIVLLFNVDDYLMFSHSKNKIDALYASLQAHFKIEDNIEICSTIYRHKYN